MFMIAPLVAAGLVSGGATLFGGLLGNRGRSREATRSRQFAERMRNSQWQAGVADMEAAGLNPALAYSQGPAAAPAGPMAQQMDALGPAISSAQQAMRMRKDLELQEVGIRKAKGEADSAEAKGKIDRFRQGWLTELSLGEADDAAIQPILRLLEAEVGGAEQRSRKDRLSGDIMKPMAGLSEAIGAPLAIMMLLSQLSPGGAVKGVMKRGGRMVSGGKARAAGAALRRRQKSFLRRAGG